MKKLIKIESIKNTPFKKIDWKLSNVCNYDCAYCYTVEKDGSLPFKDIVTNKAVVDKVCDMYAGEKILFTFTGGEPTLYPNLYELFSYIKKKNPDHFIRLITNGSRTLRWWNDFLEIPVVDDILYTFHYTQVKDIDMFISVVNATLDKEITGLVFFTCTDIDFDPIQEKFDYISDKVGIECHLKRIHGPILNNYTTEQDQILKTVRIKKGKLSESKKTHNKEYHHYGKLYYHNGTTEVTEVVVDPQTILNNNENRFFGWKCSIGIDRLVILVDTIYRGVCKMGGPIGSIYDDFFPSVEPIICLRRICTCGGEFFETKYQKH
jgi:organic radical activating enzyme